MVESIAESPLGERLKELRKKLDVSQEQLAQRLGVSVGTVSRWETGRAEPQSVAQKAALAAMGATVGTFMFPVLGTALGAAMGAVAGLVAGSATGSLGGDDTDTLRRRIQELEQERRILELEVEIERLKK